MAIVSCKVPGSVSGSKACSGAPLGATVSPHVAMGMNCAMFDMTTKDAPEDEWEGEYLKRRRDVVLCSFDARKEEKISPSRVILLPSVAPAAYTYGSQYQNRGTRSRRKGWEPPRQRRCPHRRPEEVKGLNIVFIKSASISVHWRLMTEA